MKKEFPKIYYLACEGSAEYNLFAYLKYRFKDKLSHLLFIENTSIRDENGDPVLVQGKLKGAKHYEHFKHKYNLIKLEIPNNVIFFMLDTDLYHSGQIIGLINQGNDFVEAVKYNIEFFLLSKDGFQLKDISEFGSDFQSFRNYCKIEFFNKYGKDANRFNTNDFNKILGNYLDEDIIKMFPILFSL